MKIQTLMEPTGPWLHLFVGAESEADNLWRCWERSSPPLVVRQVRGPKAQTALGLFDEFAAAWQFPCYFGENWDALEECLTDLSWLPADVFVLGIRGAAQLLEEEATSAWRHFWSVLSNVTREGAEEGHSARRFWVVLQCLASEESTLRRRLGEANIPKLGEGALCAVGEPR